MPTIDFYILAEASESSRLAFACRLLEKAYQNKHRVYVHTDDQIIAHQLDELLWTYRDDSFVPHNLYGEGPDPAPPIQIGFGVVPQNQRDILINFSTTVPDFYAQFSRIIEIVSHDSAIQNASREHYRFYRSHGLEITTHKLQSIEA